MGLIDTDLLVMDQVTSVLSNDFAIHDGQGLQVGSIVTQGSALSRFFMGSRHLTIVDEQQRPLVLVEDVMSFGRDRFELLAPDGNPLAVLVKEFTLFRKVISLQLATGEELQLQGHLFDFDFEVASPDGRQAALVSRQWPGLAAGLLGRSRFVVEMAAGLPPHLRVAVIGAVVALDLVRAKEQRAASSSSS